MFLFWEHYFCDKCLKLYLVRFLLPWQFCNQTNRAATVIREVFLIYPQNHLIP